MTERRQATADGRPRRLKIADIAARTNLSTATVSRAINGKPRISAETRARVLAVLDEVGYVPSGVAASLRTKQTGLLGLVIDSPRDPTRAATIDGAFEAALRSKARIVVYMAKEPDDDGMLRDNQMLQRGWVDGAMVLFPGRADIDRIRRLHENGLLLVLIEPEEAVPGVPTVYADAYHDGYISARHLLDLGHRRIAACGNPPGWGLEGRYLDGYRGALSEAGLPIDPELAVAAGWTYRAGYETARAWLQMPDPPTGLCFRVDMAAFGAIAAVRDLGLRVPDDVSIVGGDDTELASWAVPTLTAPRARRSGVARVACELLLGLVAGESPPNEPLLTRTDLAVRQSTAPPR